MENGHILVAALTNNKREERLLQDIGVKEIIQVDTTFIKSGTFPEIPIVRAFIFEMSLPLTCAYLQVLSRWRCRSVTVVTTMWHPQVIYKKLGASIVLHTQSGEVGFLLDRQFDDSGGMP